MRERSKALLQAQMRPFSFTRRDEEIQEIQKLSKGLSKSSPSLFLDDPPIKVQKFKAKPIPKNLFSNYIYKKMHEDEFYRFVVFWLELQPSDCFQGSSEEDSC